MAAVMAAEAAPAPQTEPAVVGHLTCVKVVIRYRTVSSSPAVAGAEG